MQCHQTNTETYYVLKSQLSLGDCESTLHTAQADWHTEADLRLGTKPREKLAGDAATPLHEGRHVLYNFKIRCDVLREDVNKTPPPAGLLDVGKDLKRDDGAIALARVDDRNGFVAHLVESAMHRSRSRPPIIQEGGFPKNSANVKPGILWPAWPTAPLLRHDVLRPQRLRIVREISESGHEVLVRPHSDSARHSEPSPCRSQPL